MLHAIVCKTNSEICCCGDSFSGEKKLPKSGLFLAAISGIAAKKEKQKMDEKKSHGSIPDKKESESTDKDDRKQGELWVDSFSVSLRGVIYYRA